MNCINYTRCGNLVDPTDPMTYWEATVFIRDRDAGGPNRRELQRTGRGLCLDCSLRVEHGLPTNPGQKALFT